MPSSRSSFCTANHSHADVATESLFRAPTGSRPAPLATPIDQGSAKPNTFKHQVHTVGSLTNFFETKLVERPSSIVLQQIPAADLCPMSPGLSVNNDHSPIDEMSTRRRLMNQVLESLKEKNVFFKKGAGKHRSAFSPLADLHPPVDSPRSIVPCPFTAASTDQLHPPDDLSNDGQYARRFRSSSDVRNGGPCPKPNTARSASSNAHCLRRAHSHDRHSYHTTAHVLNNIRKTKHETYELRSESDAEDDYSSESSMLYQAQTKLNRFVIRTKKHEPPPVPSSEEPNPPLNELHAYHEIDQAFAETRF